MKSRAHKILSSAKAFADISGRDSLRRAGHALVKRIEDSELFLVPPVMEVAEDIHSLTYILKHPLPFDNITLELTDPERERELVSVFRDGDTLKVQRIIFNEGVFVCGSSYTTISGEGISWASEDPILTEQLREVGEEMRQIDASLLATFLYYLNTYNVETITVKAPEKLNKKRRKQGKFLLKDHHVLVLRDSKKRLIPLYEMMTKREGNRFHSVRGHFRRAFGKRFWISPHFRGNRELGKVNKTYKLDK